VRKSSRSSRKLLKLREREKRNEPNAKKRKEGHRQSKDDWKPSESSEKRLKRRGW
jgi:hypothetical protein